MVPDAQRRAELLDTATVAWLDALAMNAPPLTDEQRDVIRAAFKTRQTERQSEEFHAHTRAVRQSDGEE